MSNPIAAPRDYIPAPRYPDGVFTPPDGQTMQEFETSVKKKWGIDSTRKMLERKEFIHLRPSVSMKPAVTAGLVFNEGARKRPLSITEDRPLQFRLRSLEATTVKNDILDSLETGDPWRTDPLQHHFVGGTNTGPCSRQEALDRTTETFMVSGGTQWCMGRLETALPEPSVIRYRPVTVDEANRAYENCGFYHGSSWEDIFMNPFEMQAYRELWPLVREEGSVGAAVSIVRQANLGFPYLAKAADDQALRACLEQVNYMEATWKGNVTAEYAKCIRQRPGYVLYIGKTKTDMYKRQKIMNQQLRFYVVSPGHIKLYMARAAQPFGQAKMSFPRLHSRGVDVYRSRLADLKSAQKTGLTGQGAKLLVEGLDAQLMKHGFGFLHCGDDTWFCIFGRRETTDGLRPDLMVFSVDQSNFDLTQRRPVFEAIHKRLSRGLAEICPDRAELFEEICKYKLVNVHGAGVIGCTSLSASGINLQSEINDMIEDVYCQRLIQAIAVAPRTLAGRKTFGCTWEAVERAVVSVGEAMGLSARIEDRVSCLWNYCVGSQAEVAEGGGANYAFETPLRNCLIGDGIRFKFLGYIFAGWEDDETDFVNGQGVTCVSVMPDLPRSLAGLLYPSQPWVKNKDEFDFYNLTRLITVLQNFGNDSLLFTHCSFLRARRLLIINNSATKLVHLARKMMGKGLGAIAGDDATKPLLEGEVPPDQAAAPRPVLDSVAAVARMHESADDAIYHVQNQLKRAREQVWSCNTPVAPPPLWEDVASAAPVPLSLDPLAPFVTGSWADLDDEDGDELGLIADSEMAVRAQAEGSLGLENLLLSARVGAPPSLLSLALRAVTAANWGRPPPNVPVTNPLNPSGLPGAGPRAAGGGGGGEGGGGRSATQKKREQRKRKKEREHRAGVEAAGQHYREERDTEQRAMDEAEATRAYLAAQHAADRLEEARARGRRDW